jgi:MFS family permease
MSEHSRSERGIAKILAELGLVNMWQSPRDVKLLCAQRFVRLFAYGGSTLILASYLNALGISEDRIGLFMTLTLIGDVGISFILTLFADNMGRRAVLSLGSLLMVASGVVFAAFGNYWVLLAAAIFGVISPSGNEIGPFRAVEESTLAHLTPHEHLSDVFAWYSLVGTAGAALGNLVCGWIMSSLQTIHHWDYIPSCRCIFLIYAGIGVVKLLLTVCLSRKVEAAQKAKKQNTQAQAGQGQSQEYSETQPLLADQNGSEQPAQPPRKNGFFESIEKDLWWLVIRLFILFGLDSFASGLASP